MQDSNQSCDVFVLGGGPAGSTVSALLAQRGWDVVISEKERHPRFHIGESLLPLNVPLLERLGVYEEVSQIGVKKYGAQFISPHHDEPITFYFGEAWDKSQPYSYEVRRDDFDHILFRNAAARGARTYEETRVTAVDFSDPQFVLVSVRNADGSTGTWRSRFFVDASGRDTFLASKFAIKRKNSKHASAAIYGHFTGAKRLPGKDAGNISIFWFEHGWFWFIPLRDGLTSVGAVCWPYYLKSRKTDPSTFLMNTIALCPALAARLTDAELTCEATATGNYSYSAERMSGDRHVMLGDAYAFIDPVFSSGVMLAMNSAFLACDAIDTHLRDPAAAAPKLRAFERGVRHGVRNFSWFIYRMTNPTIRNLFMQPRNSLRMQEALISLLAGDLFRGTPIHWSLRAFKAVYYMSGLRTPLRSVDAWLRRKRIIRERTDTLPETRA